jgi:hypothetical protein
MVLFREDGVDAAMSVMGAFSLTLLGGPPRKNQIHLERSSPEDKVIWCDSK